VDRQDVLSIHLRVSRVPDAPCGRDPDRLPRYGIASGLVGAGGGAADGRHRISIPMLKAGYDGSSPPAYTAGGTTRISDSAVGMISSLRRSAVSRSSRYAEASFPGFFLSFLFAFL